MKIDINSLIEMAGVLLAFFIGLKANTTSSKALTDKEQDKIAQEAYKEGKTDLKLDNISENVQKTLKKVETLDDKLSKVEDKADTANRRIDVVEKDIEEIKRNYEGT